MLKRIPILLITLMFASTPAYAAGTSGSFELGYQATSGNSDTSSANAKLELKYKSDTWQHTLKLGAAGASDHDETTQERYTALGKTEYDFSEHNYVFGAVDYAKDLFGGMRERVSETVGYGRRIINTEQQSLDAEIGIGYRQTQEQKPSLERHDDGILRSVLDYQYNITDTSFFEQTFTVEAGNNNTFLESVTALKLIVIKNLFAQLSYTVDHNTSVASGVKKTDTYTAVTLGYAFGDQS